MIKQKEVYLVDFAKKYNSECVLTSLRDSAELHGKIRPAVIMQNNFINRTIERNKYKSVMVVPLSSTTINDDFRVVIKARDNLKENSECVANWMCTLDISRVQVEKGLITTLSDDEFEELKQKVCNVM
jgi:mRNA interferase MazF